MEKSFDKLINCLTMLIAEWKSASESVRYCKNIDDVVDIYGDNCMNNNWEFVDVNFPHTTITFLLKGNGIVVATNNFEVWTKNGIFVGNFNIEDLENTLESLKVLLKDYNKFYLLDDIM